MARNDRDLPKVKDDPSTVRNVVPAILFAAGILLVIFIVFAIIEWAQFPT